MQPPSFWYPDKPQGILARMASIALRPLSAIYGWAGARRFATTIPYRAALPVICIGNLTAGGTGKTPITLALAKAFQAQGETPFILARGYGGSLPGPLRVEPDQHNAHQVGDEPLLAATHAPTLIARDRIQGAKLAAQQGASLLLMDDGFQNPSLVKDFSLLVVDGQRGFGNGQIIPAGPLREPVTSGLGRAQAIIIMGHQAPNTRAALAAAQQGTDIPQFTAQLHPLKNEDPIDQPIIAFAGIGQPHNFFASLRAQGLEPVATHSFADHHPYTQMEEQNLQAEAKAKGAQLMTTEKDFMRLSPDMRSQTKLLKVEARIDDFERLSNLISSPIKALRSGA